MGSSVQFGTTGAGNFQRPSGREPDGTHFYKDVTPTFGSSLYYRLQMLEYQQEYSILPEISISAQVSLDVCPL